LWRRPARGHKILWPLRGVSGRQRDRLERATARGSSLSGMQFHLSSRNQVLRTMRSYTLTAALVAQTSVCDFPCADQEWRTLWFKWFFQARSGMQRSPG